MKKIISMVWIVIFLVVCSATSFAVNSSIGEATKTIFVKEEITNIETLYQRAKAGITDIPLSSDIGDNAVEATIASQDGHKISLETYATTQLLKKEQRSDGTISSSYAQTAVLSLDDPTNVALLKASGSETGSGWDSSGGIYGYVTIYYNIIDNTVPTRFLLTQVSGGWTSYDRSISLSNRLLSYVCNGMQPGGGVVYNQAVYNYPISSNSFSYYTNFTQYIDDILDALLGAQTNVTLKRGTSSTWYMQIVQNRLE